MSSRSIEVIYNELVDSISSQSGSSWSALRDSMVGRELLYAGAHIISATEDVTSSITGVLDIGRYGLDQLISYAYGQDVPLDVSRPGSIKVRLTGSILDKVRVCAPFSLRINIGVLSFYNIDYSDTSQAITLYCGKPQRVLSGGVDLALPFRVFGSPLSSWRLFMELSGGSYRSSYIKLGSDAVSSSVWVFAREKGSASAPVFPYTAYNAMLSSPDAQLYKVRCLWDRTTAVVFGDGNWARKILPAQFDYSIVWLKGEYNNFSVTRGVTMSYTDLAGVATTLSQVDAGSSSVGFVVESTLPGAVASLSYARNYLISEIFKTRGLVTAVQLENFVLSFPSVQSAYLSLQKDAVTVYVKPRLEGDIAFGFIEDYLYQYGVSGMRYVCELGVPLDFVIRLRSVGSQVLNEMSRAVSLLLDRYSYDSVTMSTRVSSSLVQQELSLQGIRGVVATLYGRLSLSASTNGSYELPASAAVGSIRQYSSDDMLLGFDSEGRFKSYVSLTASEVSLLQNTSLSVSTVGDFYWLSGFASDGGSDGSVRAVSYLASILDDGRLGFADSLVAFAPTEGMSLSFAPYGDGLYCLTGVMDGVVRLWLYRASSIFTSSSYSLFNHPSYVTPLSYITGYDKDENPIRVSEFHLYPYTQTSTGVSVEVLRVLGASGVGESSDAVVCAIKYGASVYGLGVYRLGSLGSYYWDLVMMYGGSTAELVVLSSFYDGQWYMPVGEDGVMTDIGVYIDDGDYTAIVDIARHAETAPTTAWSKLYRLDGVDAASKVLSTVATLVDWRVTSSNEAWVLYKVDDSYSLSRMTFTLVSGDTGAPVCQYYFVSTYSISLSGTLLVPKSLSLVGDGSPIVYGESASGDRGWWVLSNVADKSLTLKPLSAGVIVKVTGSVDYENGVVYGVTGGAGGYLEYEISSVLGGDGSYPHLLDVLID